MLAAGAPTEFGIGVGTIVLTANAVFLALLHVRLPLAAAPGRRRARRDVRAGRCSKTAYECVSCLNRWHMKWAWISLIWVGFTDLYVRMCAMGIWTDFDFCRRHGCRPA